jgi:hypothetical protein
MIKEEIMKKVLLTTGFLFLLCMNACSDEVSFDMSAWTQEQINWRPSVIVNLLAEQGITYKNISRVKDKSNGIDKIVIEDPSADTSAILTEQNILDRYAILKAINVQATQEAEVKQLANRAFIENLLKVESVGDADASIDALTDLDEAKLLLKSLVHELRAK